MSAVGYVVTTMVVTIAQGEAAGIAYECAVTGVTFSETHKTVTAETACPDGSLTDVGPSTFTADIDYMVSNLPGSLHRLLNDNPGALATLSVEPFPVTEPGTLREADVRLVAAGDAYVVGAFGVSKVSLPVTGAVRTVDPAPVGG